jgi:GntR family transcriptional regulator/MocR family aminotransferase
MHLATILDRQSPTPLHYQIYERWRNDILACRFRPGDRVPSTRELAAALSVSRNTVSQAWDQLIAEGYLEASRGSGTFVCRELPDRSIAPWSNAKPRRLETSPVRLTLYGSKLTTDWRRPANVNATIRFLPGAPDREHFPFLLWRRLVSRHLRSGSPEIFGYAQQATGYEPLLSEISDYVTRIRAVACSPEQVIVVNGSQQGLDLCARLLVEPGNEVALENPGYHGARRVFATYGARLRPLAIDDGGAVVSDLTRKTQLIYVTPSHQYPTGVAMSLARRLELIAWARHHNAVIIEDDYCSEYRYNGPPLPSLQGLAAGVPVIYLGTFSKVMFPGLRIGYIVSPRQLIPFFRRAKWLADTHTSILEQAALAEFIREGHMERHIRRMRRLYRRRRQVLLDSLENHFGERAKVLGDDAGMHAMVRFDDHGIMQRAIRNKVELISAERFYLTSPPGGEFLLGFCAVRDRAIQEGVRRLAS